MKLERAVKQGLVTAGIALGASMSEANAEEIHEQHASPSYDVIDLGTIDGYDSLAQGINDRGDVVGVTLGGPPFVKPRRGALRALLPPGTDGAATDISNAGAIAGSTRRPGGAVGAVVWKPDGSLLDVHALLPAGSGFSLAESVNLFLHVAGYFHPPGTTTSHAFMATPRGARDLGEGQAFDVNDWGTVAGTVSLGEPKAVIWSASGEPRQLGTLGGVVSIAQAINNLGVVTGSAELPRGPHGSVGGHAFLWSHERGMQDLGALAPGDTSVGYGINTRGDVVGMGYLPMYQSRAMVVPRGGTMRDLNTMIAPSSGWLLQWAFDINDTGEIVGYGQHDGVQRAFLLRPRRG